MARYIAVRDAADLRPHISWLVVDTHKGEVRARFLAAGEHGEERAEVKARREAELLETYPDPDEEQVFRVFVETAFERELHVRARSAEEAERLVRDNLGDIPELFGNRMPEHPAIEYAEDWGPVEGAETEVFSALDDV